MTPSELIDNQISELKDWRGNCVASLRKIINSVDPKLTEEWKWGTGVWTHNGLVCAVGVFKDHVKLNFFKGAELKDPNNLINAGLESKKHRSVDFREGDKIDEKSLRELIKEATMLN